MISSFKSESTNREQSPILLAGEMFYWHEEFVDGRNLYFLTHPIFSLVGFGDTPEKAIHDLHNEITEAAKFYLHLPEEQLDSTAKDLVRFLQKLVR
jgi:hypothetical protein